ERLSAKDSPDCMKSRSDYVAGQLLYYLLQSYVPPRVLHSFPTRRSSDLTPGGWARLEACRRAGWDRQQRGVEAAPRGPQTLPHQDRKSTRLNSSHVKTSYAVFCLKKKKTMHNTGLFCNHLTSVIDCLEPL